MEKPQKICVDCNKPLTPSSRHLRCPPCRRLQRREACACGGLKTAGAAFCNNCADRGGANNGNWKGGSTYHKKGYVMRWTGGHPRGEKNNGYVFEHILVMEEALGRFLYPEETVHHLNGVRDDNRLENLELWIKPQPAGIRVEDAIVWAETILLRYGGGAGSCTPVL